MQTHTCAKLGQTSSGFSRLQKQPLNCSADQKKVINDTTFFFFGLAALTLCFLYNVHPLCSDSHCSITRTIGERRWNIAQLPFELAPAHDLMLNRFVTAERSNSKSDICQRRREWELKGRTRNCITMQEFLIFCTAATGLYRITFAFLFPRFLGAGGQSSWAGLGERRSRCLRQTSRCFTDSRMCRWGPQPLLMDDREESKPGRNRHGIHQDLITGSLHMWKPHAVCELYLNCT